MNRETMDIDSRIASILTNVKLPEIPDHQIDLLDFCGLTPDEPGTANFQPAIQEALDKLHADGGGSLYIRHPQGKDNWKKVPMTLRLRGPIQLRGKTELVIERGLTLFFECAPEAYLPGGRGVLRRYEGTMLYSFSPLIYAIDAEDIAIRSAGGAGGDPVIHGDGFEWQQWMFAGEEQREARGEKPSYQLLKDLNNEGVPPSEIHWTDPTEHFLRPCAFEPVCCKRVMLEGVRFENSPFWVVHPVFSSSLVFRDLSFHARPVNNDGIDPDSCRDILIERVIFDNHDDNIAIKSGRDREARDGAAVGNTSLEGVSSPYIRNGRITGPTENVVIRDCVFKGHYAICIGSEVGGGARNIVAVNNQAPQQVNMGVFIKSSRGRGGIVEDVHVKELHIHNAKNGCINLIPNYDNNPEAPYPPEFRNITLENVTCREAGTGIRVHGWPDALTTHIRIRNVRIDAVNGVRLEYNHVKDLVLNQVEIAGQIFDQTISYSAEDTQTPSQI